jgi:ATP/maltotriose-dependent transcriptional regulator MalT
LSQADELEPLAAADLWLLAWSAHLSGRDEDFTRAMSRGYRAYLDAAEPLSAARCAGWLGAILARGGEAGPGAGWLSRAERLVERVGVDCAERGFLLVTSAFDHAETGEYDAMLAAATQAFEIAERFGDADLAAMSLVLMGRARIARGETKTGLALLDEAMVSVTNDELLPVITGLAYCNVIESCQEVYDLRRSQQWTAALTRWCDAQPDLVPFAGQCLVHRSELLQLRGDWPGALDEANRACVRLAGRPAIAIAYYQVAEMHRLQGDFTDAEETYRRVAEFGLEPHTYESARVRVLVAQGCQALGDSASAEIELDTASHVFQQLGAMPDVDRLQTMIGSAEPAYPKGLTTRELQVLRLVAVGRTNREISSTLVISEHTVARHLQNIFSKLGVSSRTAATAFALEHSLI